MSEDGQYEIRSFGSHLKIDDIKERCIKVLNKYNTKDINILSSTHYSETTNQFFNIFSREIYLNGKWKPYWLKDINVILKPFIV